MTHNTKPKYQLPQIMFKFEALINHAYPFLTQTNRNHMTIKNDFLQTLNDCDKLLCLAIKSSTPKTKLFEIDALLLYMQGKLRFMADPKRRIITKRQQHTTSLKLTEIGQIIGAWIKNVDNKKV